jgi:tetratricopeptide (TPR) repeat protein
LGYHERTVQAGEANVIATAAQRQNRTLRNLGLLLAVVVVGILIGRYYDRAQTWVMSDLVGGGATPQTQPGQSSPAAPDPDLAAARVLFEERRYEKARDQLAELIRRTPENAEYRLWRGRSEYELKNYAEAITDLNEAARLDQNLPDVYEHLAARTAQLVIVVTWRRAFGAHGF